MKYQIGTVQNLKAVNVFDPSSNSTNSALYDLDTGLVIGFDKHEPFYGACGAQRIIDEAVDGIVLVPDSTVYGFECWCCYDDTYRLGTKPAPLPPIDTSSIYVK